MPLFRVKYIVREVSIEEYEIESETFEDAEADAFFEGSLIDKDWKSNDWELIDWKVVD